MQMCAQSSVASLKANIFPYASVMLQINISLMESADISSNKILHKDFSSNVLICEDKSVIRKRPVRSNQKARVKKYIESKRRIKRTYKGSGQTQSPSLGRTLGLFLVKPSPLNGPGPYPGRSYTLPNLPPPLPRP